jgi:hypothetical protein
VNVNQWLEWTFNGERFRIVGGKINWKAFKILSLP